MSQFSPPPPQQNFGQPGGYGAPMPQSRTSAAAVTSLVLGVLGCVPLITSFFAVILGIVGISATRKPEVTGRGMAIAGLILGLLGLAGWGAFGAFGGWLYYSTAPAREASRTFLSDLSNGKVDEAQSLCGPEVSRKSLEEASATFKKWGPLGNTTFVSASANTQAGGTTQVVVAGSAIFGTTPKSVQVQFAKQNGVYRIVGFLVQ